MRIAHRTASHSIANRAVFTWILYRKLTFELLQRVGMPCTAEAPAEAAGAAAAADAATTGALAVIAGALSALSRRFTSAAWGEFRPVEMTDMPSVAAKNTV